MIVIYTQDLSQRLHYVTEHIFKNMLQTPYRIIDDINNKLPEDIVLCFGSNEAFSDFSIFRSKLILNENPPSLEVYNSIISQEWPYFVCEPGSFDFNVDQIIFEFAEKLKHKFTFLEYKKPFEGLQLSFDIDHAWKYRNKGMVRNFGGSLKSILKGDFKSLWERCSVLCRLTPDPYFIFNEISEINKLLPIRLFLLLGNYNRLDKNIDPQNTDFKDLIEKLNANFKTGIHPSSKASGNENILKNEINILSDITNQKVLFSRQHYLLLKFPKTYQMLINSEIENDYTMGYPDNLGFRAGTAHSYQWFDLSTNKATQLWVHPFVAMDVTMRDYLKLSTEDAFSILTNMLNEVRKTGGRFEIIWHNSSFIKSETWGKWKNSLLKFLNEESNLQA
jgi:hypothetical protein